MSSKGKSRSGKDSKESQSRSSSNISSSQKTTASSARAKQKRDQSPSGHPPRSKTGCWTCRRRKVKCDEKKPVCSQCARLGEQCDYDPRLKFLSETDKMVSAMQSVSLEGCPAWDSSPQQQPPGWEPFLQNYDDMPPFSALDNDEERERKAAFQAPGTYNTVLVPDSFAGTTGSRSRSRGSRSGGGYSHPTSPQPTLSPSYVPSTGRGQDPNVVVLDRFEEPRDRAGGEAGQRGGKSPSTQAGYYPEATAMPYGEYFPNYQTAPLAFDSSYQYDPYSSMATGSSDPSMAYYDHHGLSLAQSTETSFAAYSAGLAYDTTTRTSYPQHRSGSVLQEIVGYEQYVDPRLQPQEEKSDDDDDDDDDEEEEEQKPPPRKHGAPPAKRHDTKRYDDHHRRRR